MKKVLVKGFIDEDGLTVIETEASVFLVDIESEERFDKSGWSTDLNWALDGAEIDRISRLSAIAFVKKNYHAVVLGERELSSLEVKKILDFLRLTYEEAGQLLGGLKKSTISLHVNGKRANTGPFAALLMERLALELIRPGALAAMLGKGKAVPSEPQEDLKDILEIARFSSSNAA